MNNLDEHQAKVSNILSALKEARIFAGAEFEACCNEMEHSRAIYFSGLRGQLAAYIKSLEDYKYLLDQESKGK